MCCFWFYKKCKGLEGIILANKKKKWNIRITERYYFSRKLTQLGGKYQEFDTLSFSPKAIAHSFS